MKILRISRTTTGHYGIWAIVFFATGLMFGWPLKDVVLGRDVIAPSNSGVHRWWHYLEFAIFAVLAAGFFYASIRATRAWWRRYRRMWSPHGVCRRCGYDLRATPERCPECGKRTRRSWASSIAR